MTLLLAISVLLDDDNGGVEDEDEELFEFDIKLLLFDGARNRLKMHFIILERPSPIIDR